MMTARQNRVILMRSALGAIILMGICQFIAKADNSAQSCAASPYRVGDPLTRLGPSGDRIYNSMHVRRIYVVFDIPRKADCLAALSWCRSHPEPSYVQRIAGWLYRASGTWRNDPTVPPVTMSFYYWYSRGYEMDAPLNGVDDALASVILRVGHLCP